jgi:hypothetical protein
MFFSSLFFFCWVQSPTLYLPFLKTVISACMEAHCSHLGSQPASRNLSDKGDETINFVVF